MDETAGLAPLLQAIKAVDDERTEAAVLGLQQSNEATLMQWATSAPNDLRWWAVRGLGQCGTPACVLVVVEALESGEPSLQAVAVWTLAHIEQRFPGQKDALTAMAQALGAVDGWVRQTATDALAYCGDAAVSVLEQAMTSRAESVRVRAAYALAKVATLTAAPILFQALHDDSPLVRTVAYDGLDAMGLFDNVLVVGD